jgi:hypothetical protein
MLLHEEQEFLNDVEELLETQQSIENYFAEEYGMALTDE